MKPDNTNRLEQPRWLIAAALLFTLFSLSGFVSRSTKQPLPANNVELVHSQKQQTLRHSFSYTKYVGVSNQSVLIHNINEHDFLLTYNHLCDHMFIESKNEFDYTKSSHTSFLRKTFPLAIDYPIMPS